MGVETEAGRAGLGVVAPGALEDAAAVVDDVGGDVNLRLTPLHELAVHPDEASARKRHWDAPLEDPNRFLGSYCVSPQNGHFAVRACSGLAQCQQKRGWGVSRARRRDWMSATLSSRPASARPGRLTVSRAASTSSSTSDGRL